MASINKNSVKKLWNPKSFIIFSVFFSFIPSAIMCGLNYSRCGYVRKKWIVLVTSIVGFTVLVIFASRFLVSISGIFIAINICVGVLLYIIQNQLYVEHIQNGGEKASYFLPIVIGILIFTLSTASIIYSIYVPKKSLTYDKNHLFYTSTISDSEAKKLGDYLKKESYFTSTSEIDVKIDRQKDLYILSLVIEESYINNQGYIEPMKTISKEFSQNVFSNNKVRIDLCNDRFKVLKSVSPA